MLNSYTLAAVKSTSGSSPPCGLMPGWERSATGESDIGIAEEKILPPVIMLRAVPEEDEWDVPGGALLGPAVAEKKVDAELGLFGVDSGWMGPMDGDGVSRLTRGADIKVVCIDPASDGRSTCPRLVAGLEKVAA